MRTARVFVPLLLVLLAGCGGGQPATTLDAGGATFVQPIMKFWTDEYREITDDKVKINYQGTGSSDGVKKMTSREYAFGCSDAPLNAKEVDAAAGVGGPVLHVPLVVGGVVPAYHLDVSKPVAFTGPVLADIFLGKIKRWNDPRLVELNKDAGLPDLEIQPVFRSEGSGTSYVFTEYLSKASDEFKQKVGATKTFPDKVGVGKKGSDGVAGHIAATNGAIGYIELTYALDTKAKYGTVRNKANKDVLADTASLTAAAAAGMGEKQTGDYALHDLTYCLTDQGGADSYPIAATSFALLYKTQKGEGGKAVVAFLKWAAGDEGQKLSEKRNYAPLPPDLRKKVADKLAEVRFE